jgi:protein-S-isoprenylcysteine O-methyltransferase Ste14
MRTLHMLLMAICFMLLFSAFDSLPLLTLHLLPQNDITGISGCIICAAGVLFAIWARYTLGSNWSGTVTVKANHELIQSGPYSLVRHPIYTGALFAFLGNAIVIGEVKGLLALLICFCAFRYKLVMEEQFMSELFPAQYPDYRKRVKMLVPFVY